MLYLSKVATVWLTPIGFCLTLALMGLALAVRGRRGGLGLVLVALLLLWVAAMPIAAQLALGGLEARYPAVAAEAAPTADVAIVLGGGVRGPVPPRPGPDLGEAADRVLYAAELFKARKVERVLVSGGNFGWGAETAPEAETIRALLIGWGVPEDRIFTGSASRTTAENAREVATMWPTLGATSALLVTSAAHMPRALASFRKAGLPVTPAPTDIRVVSQPFNALDILPDADALKQSSDAMKEVIGYFVYWLRGDI